MALDVEERRARRGVEVVSTNRAGGAKADVQFIGDRGAAAAERVDAAAGRTAGVSDQERTGGVAPTGLVECSAAAGADPLGRGRENAIAQRVRAAGGVARCQDQR